MAALNGRYVIAPGYQDSDAGHWQTLWQADFGDAAVRISVRSWELPQLQDRGAAGRAGRGGNISTASGRGPWPEGRALLAGFVAGLR